MPNDPRCYELRLQGDLDPHWSAWFGGLALTHDRDGTTTLRGPVTDQSRTHGLLTKIRDLGITLISLQLDEEDPDRTITARPRPVGARCDRAGG